MDGLDTLVRTNGESSAPIDDFVAASKFQAELQTARAIRDTLGAHLEIDDARPLASLLAEFDSYDLAAGLTSMTVWGPPSSRRAMASFICGCMPPMANAFTG